MPFTSLALRGQARHAHLVHRRAALLTAFAALAVACGSGRTHLSMPLVNDTRSSVVIVACSQFRDGVCVKHGGELRLEAKDHVTAVPRRVGQEPYVVTTTSGRQLGCLPDRANSEVTQWEISSASPDACPA